MERINFTVTFHRKRYEIFVERGVRHVFKNRNQADLFIKKYKNVVHDSVIMLHSLWGQVNLHKAFYYEFIPFRLRNELGRVELDFHNAYELIYNNAGGDSASYVQFNQIRNCFSLTAQYFFLLKRYGQRYKKPELLHQVYRLSKLLAVLEEQYTRDIKGITTGISYRAQVLSFEPIENEINKNVLQGTG